MKKYVFLFLLLSGCMTAMAGNRQRLFHSWRDSVPYRIPTIAVCSNGRLVAAADYRYCHSDIGYGAIDLHFRLSRDNGRTWGPVKMLADGTGKGQENVWNYAFGDCALVGDRTSHRVLAMSAGGKVPYMRSTRENPIRNVCFRSNDCGKTWTGGEEITEKMYGLFDKVLGKSVGGLFFASGRMCQSRQVKVGHFYRLYAAVLTRVGVYVVWSDDFGETWQVLGEVGKSPCPNGDETKCEELPDGSVLLSSRTTGRYFNRFTFTDVKKGQGCWDVPMKAPAFNGIRNDCNGEILLVSGRRKTDGRKVNVLLQSVPLGPGRQRVTLFYKVLAGPEDYASAQQLASGWKQGREVSMWQSAYSTMILQHDGRIGFLWEEGPTVYNIDYESLSLKDITGGELR